MRMSPAYILNNSDNHNLVDALMDNRIAFHNLTLKSKNATATFDFSSSWLSNQSVCKIRLEQGDDCDVLTVAYWESGVDLLSIVVEKTQCPAFEQFFHEYADACLLDELDEMAG